MRTLRLMFLDNPFLVKALRARREGGRVYILPLLFAALGILGMGTAAEIARRYGELYTNLGYYMQTFDALYLTVLMGAALLIAITAASQSIVQEIVSGTLEFQRLTTLTVRQIVLGKAIGEPVTAYLVVFAAFPILVISTLLGGYALRYKLFAVLLTFTTIFVMACMGTIVPARSVEKAGKGMSPVAGGMFGFGWFIVPVVLTAQGDGVIGLLVGLVTPLPFVVELWLGDFFSRAVTVFGSWQVKINYVTPVAQVIFGLLGATIAARVLRRDERPPIHRVVGYVLAIVFAFACAALADSPRMRGGLLATGAMYPLTVMAATFVVFLMCVPARDGYARWIWRDSEKGTGWLRYLYEDRSPGWLALAVFTLVAVVALEVFYLQHGQWRSVHAATYWVTAGAALLCLVVYGAMAHGLSLAFGRAGFGAVVGVETVFLLLGPATELVLHGYVSESPAQWSPVSGASLPLVLSVVIDQLSDSLAATPQLPWRHLAVFISVRVLLFVLTVSFIIWWTKRRWRRILGKKRAMGVLPAEGPTVQAVGA